MERIKRSQVEGTAASVNAMLKSPLHVEVEGRNGYWAIDLADDGPGVIRTLHAGTLREVYEYLHAMRETLYIIGRD